MRRDGPGLFLAEFLAGALTHGEVHYLQGAQLSEGMRILVSSMTFSLLANGSILAIFARIGRGLEFGRRQQIDHQRHQQQAHQAGQQHVQRPGGPRQMKAVVDGPGNEVHHQRVGRRDRYEHRRGDGLGVVVRQRQLADRQAVAYAQPALAQPGFLQPERD